MQDTNSIDNYDSLTSNEQQILLDWCQTLKEIKTFNKRHDSYGLKSYFEKSKNGFYITNGSFKCAMIKAGFSYQESTSGENWYFNVSEKSIKSLK